MRPSTCPIPRHGLAVPGVSVCARPAWHLGGRALGLLALVLGLGGCGTLFPYWNASFNEPLRAELPAPAQPTRATLKIDGQRGHPKVLFLLALSGGGSRAGYLSSSTMLALQRLGLLDEVDVLSSVSGGSLAAAYYAASRDRRILDPGWQARVARASASLPAVSARLSTEADGALSCRSPLEPREIEALRAAWPAPGRGTEPLRLAQLCESAAYPPWDAASVREAMKTNFLLRWFGNWFWPPNVLKYWTSSFDRSDLMAQTLENRLYSRRGLSGLVGGELTLGELNPSRPYLIVNATNASNQRHSDGRFDEYPFGSVFTFTEDDFIERTNSEVRSHSLGRAVMASSAFPLVFASMSLRDHRPGLAPPCPPHPVDPPCHDERYLHVFDGGNSDNLGLRSIKRALLQLEVRGELAAYDRVLVLLVDAFTTPTGADRDRPDPRSILSLLLDTNVSTAVDALLQRNRESLLNEFDRAQLGWDMECGHSPGSLRQWPAPLCAALDARQAGQGATRVDLSQRLVFYHFGFEDVLDFPAAQGLDSVELKRRLDRIPTSFKLGDGDALLLDEAVDRVIGPGNACLAALQQLTQADRAVVDGQAIDDARKVCRRTERSRAPPSP